MSDRLRYVKRIINQQINRDVICLRKDDAHWLLDEVERLRVTLEDADEPKPIDQWGEDYGDCLWWSLPIEEPPYCGTPLDSNFPNYVTHFTRLIVPQAE